MTTPIFPDDDIIPRSVPGYTARRFTAVDPISVGPLTIYPMDDGRTIYRLDLLATGTAPDVLNYQDRYARALADAGHDVFIGSQADMLRQLFRGGVL